MPQITLQSIPDQNKIKVIKIIRETTGFGSAEGQLIVDTVASGTPFTIKNIPRDRIQDAIEALEAAGCTVETGDEAQTFHPSDHPIEYNILSKKVTFRTEENRYLDLLCVESAAISAVFDNFPGWYQRCRDINTVTNQYSEFVCEILEESILRPLFQWLTDFEIYDVSWKSHVQSCADFSATNAALQRINTRCGSIDRQLAEEEAYREARKDGRTRWGGSGVGISGAITSAAKAGMMNAASGAAHSMVNAVGNAGSQYAADVSKGELYKDKGTRISLQKAICADIHTVAEHYINVLNQRKGEFIANTFNADKAAALFENAKNMPDKRNELLVQAFTFCPWNDQLLKYIFVNSPESRKTIVNVSRRFSVDLSSQLEAVLSKEYTEEERQSEAAALAAKARIRALMQEYSVAESQTLDMLETDCLQRLCQGYESANQDTCRQLAEAVKKYDAKEALKEPFLGDIQKRIETIWIDELSKICQGCQTADETSCEELVRAVKGHNADDAIKEPFLKKLQGRIKTIWSAEDGEIFDNLYLKTDIFNQNSINEAIIYVQSKGRTSSAERYLAALRACTPQKIKAARQYKYSNLPRILLAAAVLSLLGCLVGLSVVSIPLAIVLLVVRQQMKKAWETLTLGGKVIHPVLTATDDKM